MKYLFSATIAALVALAPLARGANITWNAPITVSGTTDVSTAGTLIQASNIGDSSTPSTMINGVTFNPWVMNGTGSNSSGVFTLSAGFGINGYNGYGSSSAPFTSLPPSYQNLLAYGNYGSGNSAMTLTIGGLVAGMTYQFQVWINDSRGTYGSQTVTASAGNSVAIMGDTTASAGGIGQYAIGTFVADALTQIITFTGGAGQGTTEEAFQLRVLAPTTPSATPETGSTFVLLLGACGLISMARARLIGGAKS